jgi:acetolactate decarboxylase
MIKKLIFGFALSLSHTIVFGQNVQAVGAMRQTMWQGHLAGKIDVDTLTMTPNIYGLGPKAFLTGELLILNSKTFLSTVNNKTMIVEETKKVEAPFFVYTQVKNWVASPLPDTVVTLKDLEIYLDSLTQNKPRPFAFRLVGAVEMAKIHIVDVPNGATIKSPDDAHKHNKVYSVRNEIAEILGFFSTEHQGVFTHHDTFLHLHLITEDHQKMGHLDDLQVKKGAIQLFLPQD